MRAVGHDSVSSGRAAGLDPPEGVTPEHQAPLHFAAGQHPQLSRGSGGQDEASRSQTQTHRSAKTERVQHNRRFRRKRHDRKVRYYAGSTAVQGESQDDTPHVGEPRKIEGVPALRLTLSSRLVFPAAPVPRMFPVTDRQE